MKLIRSTKDRIFTAQLRNFSLSSEGGQWAWKENNGEGQMWPQAHKEGLEEDAGSEETAWGRAVLSAMVPHGAKGRVSTIFEVERGSFNANFVLWGVSGHPRYERGRGTLGWNIIIATFITRWGRRVGWSSQTGRGSLWSSKYYRLLVNGHIHIDIHSHLHINMWLSVRGACRYIVRDSAASTTPQKLDIAMT